MKIQNKSLLNTIFVMMFLLVGVTTPTNTILAAENDRPNVVLFFIDDLGYKDLGCYGSSFYETPRIDKLAKQGVRFSNFYSANPVCSPTRAALMTGKAPQRLGITQWINQNNSDHLPKSEVTLGKAFTQAGYKTAYIGKWHLGHQDAHMPQNRGFQKTIGVNHAGQPASYFFPYRRNRDNKKGSPWDVPDLDDGKQGDYLTDKLTDRALSFITENKEQPFFLCFAHYAVHTPIQSPPKLVAKYKEKAKQLKGDPKRTQPERNGAKSRMQQSSPAYAAMIENLDSNVGRVLDHLNSLKLTEKTIIMFTSDNGGLSTLNGKRSLGPTSCLPLRAGKGWTYEGGIRIPTIVSWPNQLKPQVCDTPGITMDIYPTLLQLAGIDLKPKQHLDGQSLVSALQGKTGDKLKQRFLAWTYPHNHGSGHSPSNAIRQGHWKLIQLTDTKTPDDKRLELYHLQRDIRESQNVAAKHPEVVSRLKTKLEKWLDETNRK